MKTKARTFHLDQKTFENLEILAGIRSVSRSSFIRTLINEEFLDDRFTGYILVQKDQIF